MKVLLIVDDEAFARQAIADTIPWKEYGIKVFQVASGKEALKFMEEHSVDVLLTDIRMPSMTGLELLEKVDEKGWTLGRIVLSSFNEFELVRSAMQMGAEDYLFKPTMMPDDILKAVIRVLEKKREEKKLPEEISKKEILYKFLLGEKMQKDKHEDAKENWKSWECTEYIVVSVQLLKYQECLASIFGNDLNLMQFSIGNVLQEVLENECECFVFRINYKEYAVVCCKNNVLESKKSFIQKIYERLNSGFTFLDLYYQVKMAAGISTLKKGVEFLPNQYAEAIELCTRADVNTYRIQFSGTVNISGSMKREVLQALKYIDENLGNKELSLQMIADRIGVSKNYFSKIFKESMGIGFVEYITRQRLEQARNLYLNSDLKIYEIAEIVGYSDWHYLYNIYKKTYGHSLSKEKHKKHEKS